MACPVVAVLLTETAAVLTLAKVVDAALVVEAAGAIVCMFPGCDVMAVVKAHVVNRVATVQAGEVVAGIPAFVVRRVVSVQAGDMIAAVQAGGGLTAVCVVVKRVAAVQAGCMTAACVVASTGLELTVSIALCAIDAVAEVVLLLIATVEHGSWGLGSGFLVTSTAWESWPLWWKGRLLSSPALFPCSLL